MFARKWIIAAAILGQSVVAFGSNVDGISLTHHEFLERVSVSSKGALYARKPGEIGPVELSFDAYGRTFDLELVPNARLLAALPGGESGGAATPYMGHLQGVADSWARIVIADGTPAGVIWDGAELYAIEKPGDSIVSTREPVIFRLKDVLVAPGALSCASGSTQTDGAQVYKSVTTNLKAAMAQGPGAVSEINIGTLGDAEFTSDHAADPEAAIMNRMNLVDGYFSEQLGVQINPVIETFTAGTDPFISSTDPAALLNDVAAYRQATPGQMAQGLTHLWTGRDLDGTTVGIAFTGALCFGPGAAVSEGNGGATFDSLVAAHEIGHNFGAPHDGDPMGACDSAPPGFLMAPMLNNSSQFSDCSIAQMQQRIAAASCITPLPSTDIAVEYNNAPPTILLSNAATVTFDIVNNGTEPALNVNADITLPGNVSFIAASGSTAACTDGSGTVNCAFGDIAGGSATTVTVSADTLAVGVGSFDATVTADADDNGTNNQASAILTVDPAVNLVATEPGQATVNLNQGTSVSISLSNQSELDATGVTLSVTMGTGLRADSASWSLGSCTVTASQVDCVAAQFDSQSNSIVSIGLSGTATGNKAYSFTLSSAEADADPADNSFNGAVRVSDNSDDDEGGGSLGWLFLALLACAGWRRRASGSRRIS